MSFDDVNLFVTEVFAGHARRRPDHPAVVDAGGTTSWRDLDALLERIAGALHAAGLARGDRVAVLMAPSAACVAAMFAPVRAGGVLVPCSTMLSDDQLATLLADSGARFLIVSDAFRRQGEATRARLSGPSAPLFVAHGFEAEGWTGFDAFLAAAPGPAPTVALAPLDPFSIMYSSGTTGLPKGVVHSQRARTYFALSNAIEMRFSAESRAAITTPLNTAASWLMLLPTLFCGGTVHLLPGFDPAGLLATIARERITHTFVVPSQIIALLQSDALEDADLSSLRTVLSAGSPLRPDVKRAWLAHVPNAFYELYGFTEGAATLLRPEDQAAKPDTVGAPLLGTEFVVIDGEGRRLPPGEPGELCGRCPGLMSRYHGRDGATREAIWRDAEGRTFMRSGDIGMMDAEGFVKLLDRKKDMIISGGLNVFPTDLEAAIGAHPAVRDVAVIGMPDAKWGETPLALIIPREGATETAETIAAWANERLARYQRIRHARFVDDFPRNALGKVLKRELRAIHSPGTTP